MTEATAPASGSGGHDDHPLEASTQRIEDGPRGGGTWYDVLEVQPDVSAVDLKKAYDRALALVEGRNIGGYLMLDPLAAESARANVEAAFAVLGDADRRRAYDERVLAAGGENAPAPAKPVEASARMPDGGSDDEQRRARELLEMAASQADPHPAPPGLRFTAPAEPSEEAPVSPGKPSTGSATATAAPEAAASISIVAPAEEVGSSVFTNTPHEASASPLSDVTIPATLVPSVAAGAPPSSVPTTGGLPDRGEIAGTLIRELREARGLTLDALAEATKIRKPYLRAVEEEDVPNLPARVYLRGFLTQIARVLRVDRARLAEGYLLTVERVSKDAPPSAT